MLSANRSVILCKTDRNNVVSACDMEIVCINLPYSNNLWNVE